jgi:hypothetical protein
MSVKIIKGALSPPTREPAPLVEDAPKATVEPNQAMLDAQSLAWWNEHGLAPGAQPKTCPYCKHPYLKPCGEQEHVNCQNWRVVRKRMKKNVASAD